METEHRELILACEDLLEFSKGQDHEHGLLLRMVWRVRAALTQGSNGTKFWNPSLPRPARLALTLLNDYLRRSSRQ